MSFAVGIWLSKMHKMEENSGKGGRNIDEKMPVGFPDGLIFIIYLLFFLRFCLSGLQILPDPALRRGYVHPSQGSG